MGAFLLGPLPLRFPTLTTFTEVEMAAVATRASSQLTAARQQAARPAVRPTLARRAVVVKAQKAEKVNSSQSAHNAGPEPQVFGLSAWL